jgi:hypothetical protein
MRILGDYYQNKRILEQKNIDIFAQNYKMSNNLMDINCFQTN